MSSAKQNMVVVRFPDGTLEKFRPGKTAAEVIKGCSRDVRTLKDPEGINLTPDDVCGPGVYDAIPLTAADLSDPAYMSAKIKADMAALKGSDEVQLRKVAAEVAREKMALHETVTQQEITLQHMELQLRSMEQELKRAAEEDQRRRALLSEREKKKQFDEAELKRLADFAREEELKRRHLHNLIQDVKGSIRVYVRFSGGPPAGSSTPRGSASREVPFKEVIGSEDKAVAFIPPLQETSNSVLLPKKTREFEFTRVFWPHHAQGDIYQEVHELVQSALDGQDVAILGYGPSKTGKTHTLLGPVDYSDYSEERGLVPRVVQQLFTHYEELRRKNWVYHFKLCCIAVDNNSIRDLLSGGAVLANGKLAPHHPPSSDDPEHIEPRPQSEKKHVVYEHKGKGGNETHISGVTVVKLVEYKDLKPLLQHARRAFASPNSSPSRRHFVLQLRIRGQHDSGLHSHGTLNVVDLAPSDSTGARDADAVALTEVIAAVCKGSPEVQFQRRVLTHILQDCLGPKSKVLVFLTSSLDMARALPSFDALVYGENLHKLGMLRNEMERRKGNRARSRRSNAGDMHLEITTISHDDPTAGLPTRRFPAHRSRSIAVTSSSRGIVGSKSEASLAKGGTLRIPITISSSNSNNNTSNGDTNGNDNVGLPRVASDDGGAEKKRIPNSLSSNALSARRTLPTSPARRSKSKPRETTSATSSGTFALPTAPSTSAAPAPTASSSTAPATTAAASSSSPAASTASTVPLMSSVRLTISGSRQNASSSRRDASTTSLPRRSSQSSVTSASSAGSLSSPRRGLSPSSRSGSDMTADIISPDVDAWVQSLIGKKLKSPRRELANGAIFAEILAKRYSKEVGNPLSYNTGTSTEKRTENWERLQKVFAQIGFVGPSSATVQDVIDAKPGAAVLVLQKLHAFFQASNK